jgi:hypothetical protein
VPLAELQQDMARIVLGGEATLAAVKPAPVPLEAALGVHRDTVLGALIGALRLTFPTVDELVGGAFFDQAARAFIEASPPRAARLSNFGEGLPAFLARYTPASRLAYLADVARLDLAIAGALSAPLAPRDLILIDARVSIELPYSLTALELSYPADLVRQALDEGDDAAMASIDLTARKRFVAVWRRDRRAAVRHLDVAAGRFLATILASADADRALAAAFAESDRQAALGAIQARIFAAPFCRIINHEEISA